MVDYALPQADQSISSLYRYSQSYRVLTLPDVLLVSKRGRLATLATWLAA